VSKEVFEYLVECAVEEIAVYLVRTEKLSEAEALGRIYHSDFYTRLTNRKTGLFGESRACLIHLFKKSQAAA